VCGARHGTVFGDVLFIFDAIAPDNFGARGMIAMIPEPIRVAEDGIASIDGNAGSPGMGLPLAPARLLPRRIEPYLVMRVLSFSL